MPLVAALPPQPDPPEPAPDDIGPDAVVLCQEDDPATLTAILTALQDADIRYYDYPIHNPHSRLDRPFPMKLLPGPRYEICVARRDLSAAQGVLKEVEGRESAPSEAYVLKDSFGAGPAPDNISADEALPQDTTLVEVWTGEAGEVARFLAATLRENGIPSRREELDSTGTRLRFLVPAAERSRAREIVREIFEASPPE